MDALEAILSIVIIVAAVTASNRKKKAKQIKKSIRNDVMANIPSDHMPDMRPAPVQQSLALPVKPVQKAETDRPVLTESTSIPFTEGIDPCHDDMFAPREDTFAAPAAEVSPVGQELVRGFVMGEILSRPKFKTAGRN